MFIICLQKDTLGFVAIQLCSLLPIDHEIQVAMFLDKPSVFLNCKFSHFPQNRQKIGCSFFIPVQRAHCSTSHCDNWNDKTTDQTICHL